MCKDKQTIHYCTILSTGQWDFLLKGKFSAFRQKCLHRLMTGAVRARTVYKIKGVEIVLEVGQVAASDVELAEYLGCNRKTIGKLVDSLNRLGMLTTRTNNRTSIHTLHFLVKKSTESLSYAFIKKETNWQQSVWTSIATFWDMA